MKAFGQKWKGRLPWILLALFSCVAGFACALSHWIDSQTRSQIAKEFRTDALSGRMKKFGSIQKLDFVHQLELITYDWRSRRLTRAVSSNDSPYGLLVMDEGTVTELRRGLLGDPVNLLFPRVVYGLAVQELGAQGARGIAFDIQFPDHRLGKDEEDWDRQFARAITESGNVILASLAERPPAPMFSLAANTWGDVETQRDVDGTSRRIRACTDYKVISTRVLKLASAGRWEVETITHRSHDGAVTNALRLVSLTNGPDVRLSITADGSVEMPLRSGGVISLPAFEEKRVWHLGIALAALDLGLDLANAEILPRQVTLRSTNGVVRRIPLDDAGYLTIDWRRTATGDAIPMQKLEELLDEAKLREAGVPHSGWSNRLVVVGSRASGNNLSDLGATPLASLDHLVATYVNVADSVRRGEFIWQWPWWVNLLVVSVISLGAGWCAWKLPLGWSWVAAAGLGIAWSMLAFAAFDFSRLWLPVAHPWLGLLIGVGGMTAYRSVFEQGERRRMRNLFSRLVSPAVVHELLRTDLVRVSGARSKVTVFFADVRGFTELTDRSQAEALEYAKANHLSEAAAELHFDAQAREILDLINEYLATVARVIQEHNGTLDKYIGDCVMAFWGAPLGDENQAVSAVRAAIAAQQAVERLNRERSERASSGSKKFTALSLGTGINTGMVTVGLMGSDAHLMSYTVFGREVNLASRLEGVSGHGRIIIGEGTFRDLQRLDPELAAKCRFHEPVRVKGFRDLVPIHEVSWRSEVSKTAGAEEPV